MGNKNNKGLIVLVVILFIWCLGLTGFVVYDKVLSNDKEENKITEVDNDTKKEEDNKYIKVEKYNLELNNKNIEVSFNYFLDNVDNKKSLIPTEGDYKGIYLEVKINKKLVENTKWLINIVENNNLVEAEKIIDEENISLINNVKKLKGTDKDYVVLSLPTFGGGLDTVINPIVTNENGKNIYAFQYPHAYGIHLETEDEKSFMKDKNELYYIESDKIHFIKEDCNDSSEINISEYILTINNDSANIEKIGSYKGVAAGAAYCHYINKN